MLCAKFTFGFIRALVQAVAVIKGRSHITLRVVVKTQHVCERPLRVDVFS